MFVCQKNAFSSKEVVQSYALFLKNLRQFVPKTFTYVSCHPKMPVFCVKNVKTGDVPSGKGGRAGGVKKMILVSKLQYYKKSLPSKLLGRDLSF